MTSALKSNPSHLRELDLSWNELLGDSGVKNLSDLLMNTQFKLEKLDLSVCSITEKQCFILTSALKSNPSHLRELNLSWNKLLGDSGVKNLSDLLMNTQFKLEKLELVSIYSTAVTLRLKITVYFQEKERKECGVWPRIVSHTLNLCSAFNTHTHIVNTQTP
uniref:Uncharacterized protein n=1 Tax=Cyprinus carpio TaxID=7962 RepID=A0A8C1SWF0_CYPCA